MPAATQREILISKGNSKMGKMMIFSIPAGDTCPGRSELCFEKCYARKGRFVQGNVKRAYDKNLKASKRLDFVEIVTNEINRRNEKIFRIHTAGDFYDAEYTRKWLDISRNCPDVVFYCYTRSWRIDSIRKVLIQFKNQPNVRVWFSIDKETGFPERRYKGIRYAYMSTAPEDIPAAGRLTNFKDLVFRDHVNRKEVVKNMGGAMVCTLENGTDAQISCEECKFCITYIPKDERKLLSLKVVK